MMVRLYCLCRAILTHFSLPGELSVKMSDPYERAKGNRLAFKGGGLATSSKSISKNKKKKLALRSKTFLIIAGVLYEKGIDQVIRRCVPDFEQGVVLKEAHQGIC